MGVLLDNPVDQLLMCAPFPPHPLGTCGSDQAIYLKKLLVADVFWGANGK